MKIVVMSDLHGYLPKIHEGFDLMLLGGDIVALDYQRSSTLSEEWYESEFIDWLNELPFNDKQSKVIMIAGNHSVGIERMSHKQKAGFIETMKKYSGNRWVYLENEQYDFTCGDQTISIYGTPQCKIFGHWAFMLNPEKLEEYYSKIPENIDILLTHDSPSINNVGTILQKTYWSDGTVDAGNPQLTDAILKKKPKYVFCGHIHSGNHELTEYLPGKYIRQCSILDEHYNYAYEPFYFIW